MSTKILFFGSLAERLGRQTEVDVPAGGCTVLELRQMLARQNDDFGRALSAPGVRASVDQQIARDGDSIRPGQEISFFPIVSGG